MRPVPARRAAAQHAVGDEVVEHGQRAVAEQRELLGADRALGGGRAQVRGEHVRVGRVERGRLDGDVQHRLGMVDEVGVERVLARDEGDEPVGARTPGTAGLLPERDARPRPPRDEHRVEAGDVHAELERVRRRERAQRTGPDRVLERSSFLGQVPAAVGLDRGAQRRVGVGDVLARGGRDRLRRPARARERQRPAAVHDEVGQEVGDLGGRRAARPGLRFARGRPRVLVRQQRGPRSARVRAVAGQLGRLPQHHGLASAGEASWVTDSTSCGSTPSRRAALAAGSAVVAEASTNVGEAP